ncbi:hypothetical protein PABG_00036 [Paracoccidioides brasiliensis Pb03]|nr:hypothetical protein PABG_00036 [Paracoccidioides brasiliensis Pb03]
MSSNNPSPESPISHPDSGDVFPEKVDPDSTPKAENTGTGPDIPQDAIRKEEDAVGEAYHGLALSLHDCDWEQLQKKFTDAMDERTQVEMTLHRETAELLEMFIAWSQTTVSCDEDRAYKRFKTRMSFTQNHETKLEEKKKHYADVVKAFENALALLLERSRGKVQPHRFSLFCHSKSSLPTKPPRSDASAFIAFKLLFAFLLLCLVYTNGNMEGEPSKDDVALLERLNALKPSSVQLGRTPLPIEFSDTDAQEAPVGDLSTRFIGLGTSTSFGPSELQQDDIGSFITSGDEIEGLLSDLQSKIWGKSQELDNAEDVEYLLREATGFLHSASHYQDLKGHVIHSPQPFATKESDNNDSSEDRDAGDYLQRVLDEVSAEDDPTKAAGSSALAPFEPKTPDKTTTQSTSKPDTEASAPPSTSLSSILDLPATPSSIIPPQRHEHQPELDTTSPDLPSAPKFAPAECPIHIINNRHSRRCKDVDDNLKSFWCCICSDDATIKCLDCDAELLYCIRCWREMHVDEGSVEERGHRKVKFERER